MTGRLSKDADISTDIHVKSVDHRYGCLDLSFLFESLLMLRQFKPRIFHGATAVYAEKRGDYADALAIR